MTWAKALRELAGKADVAGMQQRTMKPPKRAVHVEPRDRILGAWASVQSELYTATGTPSVIEAGRRLRFKGMSLRVTDVVIVLRDLRGRVVNETPTADDAALYEELAARAVLSIRDVASR